MKVPGLILGLLLPWVAGAQQQYEGKYYGARLSNIVLSGSQSEGDVQVLPLHVGDVLTSENLRASIQALYDTGRYSQVEADAEATPEGVSLTFRLRPVFFFSTFRVEPENLLERPLSSYFRLPVGERFTTSAVDRVIEETTNLLKTEGYYQARVTANYQSNEETHLVSVTVQVMPVPRAKVRT